MMFPTQSGLRVVLALLAITVSGTLFAQPPQRPQPSGPHAIRQEQPKFLVRADVNRASRQYREGDSISVQVVSEVDAYAYVLYQQADGKVYQIFPNSLQPENRLKARQTVQIPDADDLFRWRIGPPFGREIVKVIAAKGPLKKLSEAGLSKERFNPVSEELLKGIALELGPEKPVARPPEWTEDEVEIITHDKSWQPPPPPHKRFGVFFGVARYKYDDLVLAYTHGKHSMNIENCDKDAQVCGQLFKEAGGLSDARVFVNERATRENLAAAVTQWLPAASKPGDTVFIYFSGHGGVLPPYRQGDAHVRGSFLLPCDFVSAVMLLELIKRREAGTISAAEGAQLETWLSWLRGASDEDQINEILDRRTGVPDDTFGHWLQALAGRQVVVVLDACHSGGFAAEGKALETPATFDFLAPQLSRLKDIGHDNTALLSACGSLETSQTGPELSLFTWFMVKRIRSEAAPAPIETIHLSCRSDLKAYFDAANAVRRQHNREPLTTFEPRLFNYCNRPVLLKP